MRDIRNTADIRQAELARKLGLKPQSLWKIEAGRAIPKPATIDRFCEEMKICRLELIIRALSEDDLPQGGQNVEDIIDIMCLALTRIERAKGR